MNDCTERDLERAALLATSGLEVRESVAIQDDGSILSGSVLYVRPRREGETLGDALGAAMRGQCLVLPAPEPWPIGPLLISAIERDRFAWKPETSAATQPTPEGQELRIGRPDEHPEPTREEMLGALAAINREASRLAPAPLAFLRSEERYCPRRNREWYTPDAEAHPLPPHDCEEGSD